MTETDDEGKTKDGLSSEDKEDPPPPTSSAPHSSLPPNKTQSHNAESEDSKWSCDYCTYLNWPSSVKCTLCRARGPLQRIEELANRDYSPLIYQQQAQLDSSLTDDTEANPDCTLNTRSVSPPVILQRNADAANNPEQYRGQQLHQEHPASPSDLQIRTSNSGDLSSRSRQHAELQKWSCRGCTYLNWPRSRRCVQCGAEKPARFQSCSLSPPPITVISEPTNLTINVPLVSSKDMICERPGSISPITCVQQHRFSPVPGAGTAKLTGQGADRETSGSQSPVNRMSFNLPSTSTTLDTRILAKKLQKWTCHACTYENWPKAFKCVMCYSSRPGIQVTPRVQQRENVGDSQPLSPGGGCKSPILSREGSVGGADQPAGSQSPNTGSREKKRSLQGGGGGESGEGTGRKSPKSSAPPSSGSSTENLAAAAASTSLSENQEARLERQLRRLRQQMKHLDFLWLTAVRSVATSAFDNDPSEAYLAAGGDPARALTTQEAQLLNSSLPAHRFEAGLTLIHLAVRYNREDLIALLLASADPETAPLGNQGKTSNATSSAIDNYSKTVGSRGVKRVPCHLSPDTAADIRRHVALSLRQRKGEIPCFYFTDLTTFSLPSSIFDLSPSIQQRLFDELLDRGVQKELEEEGAIINWSLDVTDRLGSRLYALWNRTAGDCLLDSVLQATWGVFDSENSLRQALSDSLSDAAHVFYPRWREYETLVAHTLQFSLDETQFARDWELVLDLASKPGSALEQAHIFVLAHIIRRPILVYGVSVVKSYRGEHLDYARFQGIYLPLLWEPSFCWRSPICLGYTRGHFTALVPMEPSGREHAAMARGGAGRDLQSSSTQNIGPRYAYLPLQDADGKVLPIHFLTRNEFGHEQAVMRTWLDICVTDGGLWCCKMKLHRAPALVQQMLDDWLDYYRRIGRSIIPTTPANPSPRNTRTTMSPVHHFPTIPTSPDTPTTPRYPLTPSPSVTSTPPPASTHLGSGTSGIARELEDKWGTKETHETPDRYGVAMNREERIVEEEEEDEDVVEDVSLGGRRKTVETSSESEEEEGE